MIKLLMLSLLPLLWGCTHDGKPTEQATLEVGSLQEPPTTVTSTPDEFTIRGGRFYGLTAGAPLADASDRLEEGVLENGEGTFDVYYIYDGSGEELGYLLPSPNDGTLIGNIFLTSPRVSTEAGIHIGDSFGKLTIAYSDVEVHGSEIEGRTYAQVGALAFLLDGVNNTDYEVDPRSIPREATIKEIMLPDMTSAGGPAI